MKKIILPILALPLLLSACGGKTEAPKGGAGDKEVVYTGTLPGADVTGIRYLLHMNYDDDHNYTDGDYRMYETYVTGDTAAIAGTRDLRTFRSEGDFTMQTGIPSDANMKYVKLVPDVSDSGPGVSADPVYFAVTSDSTLVMLGSGLEMPANPADYTLTAR